MKSIFITGMFRSGTTLLARMLDVHPDVSAVYQVITPFFRMWRNIFLGEYDCERLLQLPMGSNVLFDLGLYEKFIQEAWRVRFDEKHILQLKEDLSCELYRDAHEKPLLKKGLFATLTPGGTVEDVLIQLIRCVYPDIDAQKYVGFKEIWCEEFIPVLLKLSEVKFNAIQIIRDPRGVFASRNTGNYLKECGGKRYPLLFIAETWNRSADILFRCKDLDGFFPVRYEDIVSFPKETIQKICAFLDIDFYDDMANPENFTDSKGKQWRPNTTGDDTRPRFLNSQTNYWKTALNDEEIGSIEFLCGESMDTLGYQRKFTREQAHQLFLRYQEETDEIHPWLVPLGYVCTAARKEKELAKLERIS
ncbi:MAG: sulfotransferase [Candidatus Omnitrophica bacterium]|nr:sulfotransferase [Candidatus Omnitrophota bacterium]